MRSMNSHLNFDLDLATDQSEKNPVFYLQYAHARICNVLRYAEKSGYVLKDNFDKKLLDNPSEINLIKSLHQFPEMMLNVLESLEPQTIATYLQSLAMLLQLPRLALFRLNYLAFPMNCIKQIHSHK